MTMCSRLQQAFRGRAQDGSPSPRVPWSVRLASIAPRKNFDAPAARQTSGTGNGVMAQPSTTKGDRMSKLIALATLAAFASLASPAFAADHPQQNRMKECNVKAKGKKGDERRQFMSACLSGKDAAVKKTSATPKK
jgi:hypothetical protein